MSNRTSIRYLKQHQIDKGKWDACITASSNGLIYAYSFYLDHMAKQWDALVLNDYEAVMPLTWNKKWGIRYLYQPFLCASLGIFGKIVTQKTVEDFLLHIPSKFRYIDISLNYGNLFPPGVPGMVTRKNYILDLQPSYDCLYNNFSDNVKRNIKKSIQSGCKIIRPAFSAVLSLAQIQLKTVISVKPEDYRRFSQLYYYFEHKDAAFTYGVASADGSLLSSCIFFIIEKRAYYILVGNSPKSKLTGSSHALVNAFIKDHAATALTLDFEGSDVPGPAMFYSSFGAVEENYPALKRNLLPVPIRWIKN